MARSRLWIAIGVVELLLAAFIVIRPLFWVKYTPFVPATATIQKGDANKTDTLKMILERVNHLEVILSSSLFSLLISTTLAVGGGAYTIKDKHIPISGFTVFVGANFVYVLLSAQYYFMLTHFYSAMIFMIDQNQYAQIPNLHLLWIEFQSPMPIAGSRVPQFIYLFQATLAPLLFASITVFGLWAVFLRTSVAAAAAGWSDKHKLQLKTPEGDSVDVVTVQEPEPEAAFQAAMPFAVVFSALSLHVLVWASMIWSPFWDFFQALYGQVRAL